MPDAMKCQICNEKEASVSITHAVNGETRQIRVCGECAEQHGVSLQLTMPLLTDFLFGAKPGGVKPEPQDKSCPACHMRVSDFRKTSLLGCPRCYEAFSDEIEPFWESLDDEPKHSGKRPRKADTIRRIAMLQTSLDHAVQAQDFEEAARLRDSLKGVGSEGADKA